MEDSKGSELVSSAGYTESVQSGSLSKEERGLFDELFKALDSVVLERCAEGLVFRPIHEMPEWAKLIITAVDQSTQGLWVVRSRFLEGYVSGEQGAMWWGQNEDGTSRPEPWEEDGRGENDLDLEATAMAIGQRKLLVIKRCAPSSRAYFQLMQEKKLNLQQKPAES